MRTEVERARVLQAEKLDARVFYLMVTDLQDDEHEWLLHTAAADASLIIEVPSCAHLDQITAALDCLDIDNLPPSLTVHRRVKPQPHHQRVLRPSLSVWHFTATPHVALLVPVSFRSTPAGLVNAAMHLCPSLETTLTRGHIVRTVYVGVDADELDAPEVLATVRRCQRVSSVARVRLVPLSSPPSSYSVAQRRARRYNEMYEVAVMDGQDFAVCLSDDTRCDTRNWDDLLIRLLCTEVNALGARSLMDRAEPTRFKHALVARTHYDCFGTLFNERHSRPEHWLTRVLAGHTLIIGRTRVTNRYQRRSMRCGGGGGGDDKNPDPTDAELERVDAQRFHQFLLRRQ